MDAKPLAVRRVDRDTYDVRSERSASDAWYRVDLGDPEYPKGSCTCDDFTIRIAAPLRNHEEPERMTCKHISAANAELHHARTLCEAAGLEFSPNIIPTHGQV